MTTNPNSSRTTRNLTGRSTVAGIFRERDEAERAINELKDAGFRPDDVGVAVRDRTTQGELAEDTGTKAAQGATSGAVGGGLLGGIVGFLVGVGALALPGVGPVVAGGMLASALGMGGGTALAGAGIGAAAGGIVGALVGLGIPEDEAKHFESGVREGGVLVTVRAGARAMDAMAILERSGADTGPGSLGAGSAPRGTGASGDGHRDGPGMGTGGGALGGTAAGAAAGTVVAGPVGTVVGGAAGALGGAAAGADAADEEWTTDRSGARVRRSTTERQ